jgi:hypothetical protein
MFHSRLHFKQCGTNSIFHILAWNNMKKRLVFIKHHMWWMRVYCNYLMCLIKCRSHILTHELGIMFVVSVNPSWYLFVLQQAVWYPILNGYATAQVSQWGTGSYCSGQGGTVACSLLSLCQLSSHGCSKLICHHIWDASYHPRSSAWNSLQPQYVTGLKE